MKRFFNVCEVQIRNGCIPPARVVSITYKHVGESERDDQMSRKGKKKKCKDSAAVLIVNLPVLEVWEKAVTQSVNKCIN